MPDSLNDDAVRHVAKLSRLRLSDDEVHHFTGQLSKVLEYMSTLNELNTEGVEPMAHAMNVTNVLRPDEPTASMSVDAALANAPESSPPFFKVPKVLDGGEGSS